MLRVLADNHDLALAADDLALLTDRLYRRTYLHIRFLLSRLRRLLGPPYDPAAGQVVRGDFHRHLVAGQYTDIVHT